MNKYKKLAINITILTFLLTGGVTTTYAASPESRNGQRNEDMNLEIAILESFEDQNYEDWKKYVGTNSNLAKYITKEKFDKFIEIRTLARNGEHEKALLESEKFETELKQILKDFIEENKGQKKTVKAEKAIKKVEEIKSQIEKNLV